MDVVLDGSRRYPLLRTSFSSKERHLPGIVPETDGGHLLSGDHRNAGKHKPGSIPRQVFHVTESPSNAALLRSLSDTAQLLR
jgi:hypothetical protein